MPIESHGAIDERKETTMSDSTATITPKALAEALGTDPKTCRRFLRSIVAADNRPGKGARWAIEADAVEGLKERFAAYSNRTSKVVTVDDLSEEVEDDEELEEI